jgi:hypothetical protein
LIADELIEGDRTALPLQGNPPSPLPSPSPPPTRQSEIEDLRSGLIVAWTSKDTSWDKTRQAGYFGYGRHRTGKDIDRDIERQARILTGTLRDRQGYRQAHCEKGKDIDRHTARQARIFTCTLRDRQGY